MRLWMYRFKWMIQSTDSQRRGDTIGMLIDPDDIHIMKQSENSGTFCLQR